MSKHTAAQVEDMIATEDDAVVSEMLREYATLLAEKSEREAAMRLAAEQPRVTHRLVPRGDIIVMAGGSGGNAVSTKEEGK